MQYHVLATDFDGTLAQHGVVLPTTIDALRRVKDSGRKLILVTGRRLEPVLELVPDIRLFDRVVAENGALLYIPETGEEDLLAEAPPVELMQQMQARGVDRLEMGRAIVATWRPHESTALEVIRELAIDTQIIFNKDAVMLLPSGCNKSLGLKAALQSLQLSPLNTICIGDAENDEAMMRMAGVAVAVDNALDPVKQLCHIVTSASHGAGVEELCAMILNDDLQSVRLSGKDAIPIGICLNNQPLSVHMTGENIVVTGSPGGGKSKFATQFLEQLTERGAQACIIDPEGDYQGIGGAITLGSAERSPTVDEVINLLEQVGPHCIVSFFATEKKDRPEYFNRLLRGLTELRSRTARPHWIVVDEAHYAAPADWQPATQWHPADLKATMFITAFDDRVSKSVLENFDWVVSISDAPVEDLQAYCELVGCSQPTVPAPADNRSHQAIAWRHGEAQAIWFSRLPPELDGQRHRHSLLEGEMDEASQFVFRGAKKQLNLRAVNLKRFIELAEGLDVETWAFHLKRHDYSRWFEKVIKDSELARETKDIESTGSISPERSRQIVIEKIKDRFDSKW